MKFLGIIPSRYGSVRFPGKPLAMIGNKPMVQWVYERSKPELDDVYVATDDKRIYDSVKQFGGQVVMTSSTHRSGTDRCREALDIISKEVCISPDVVVNIQGDEPFIESKQISLLKDCFRVKETQIATLIQKINTKEDLFDENKPKVVKGKSNDAIYFSRSTIPFLRGKIENEWVQGHNYYKHIGIYAYRRNILKEITKHGLSGLEAAESLEQLRWLQNGYKIKVAETVYESIGIDTPADLSRAKRFLLKEMGNPTG